MSGQGSPVQSEAKSDPRRSALDARFTTMLPAGLRLRGSLRCRAGDGAPGKLRCGVLPAGKASWERGAGTRPPQLARTLHINIAVQCHR